MLGPKQPRLVVTLLHRTHLTTDTWLGIGSSHLGLTRPLYAESFWDDAYDTPVDVGMGKVWGVSRGLVPDPASVGATTLGPSSILSSDNAVFGTGEDTLFDTFFALNSDGGSWNEFEFNTTVQCVPDMSVMR